MTDDKPGGHGTNGGVSALSSVDANNPRRLRFSDEQKLTLKMLMAERGLTQTEFARQAGVHPSTLTHYLTFGVSQQKSSMSYGLVLRLYDALGRDERLEFLSEYIERVGAGLTPDERLNLGMRKKHVGRKPKNAVGE